MKNGVWLGGLVLALGAWTTPSFGQDSTAPKPAQPATAAAQSGPTAGTPAGPAPACIPGNLDAQPAVDGLQPGNGEKPRFFFWGEYLLWWVKQDKVPVLASTSTNPFDNGELGQPTTSVLFGGDGIDGSARSGFRFTAAAWLDDCQECGVFFRGFYLSPRSTNFEANSSQFPTLARPFFNINQGIEFSQLTAFPGLATGTLEVHNQSELWGAEANVFCPLCCGCNYGFNLFGGFRYLQLNESLTVVENFNGLPAAGPPFANNNIVGTDFFGTRNQFYGGQVGVFGEWRRGRFSVETWAQVALGDTHQDLRIDGSQVLTTPTGATQVFKGDLLALPSNIGHTSRDRFSVVPEVDLNVGYWVTDHVRAFVGYDWLYWNNVIRPGGQIDRNIDISQIPNFIPGVQPTGQNRPAAPQNSTDFWAQGVTFGFELRY